MPFKLKIKELIIRFAQTVPAIPRVLISVWSDSI